MTFSFDEAARIMVANVGQANRVLDMLVEGLDENADTHYPSVRQVVNDALVANKIAEAACTDAWCSLHDHDDLLAFSTGDELRATVSLLVDSDDDELESACVRLVRRHLSGMQHDYALLGGWMRACMS